MEAKIRVYGKSQSRTALGIINAYLKLFPDATLADLQQAFPASLNPKSFTDSLLVPVSETKGHEKQFFEKEEELVELSNGDKLALVELWRKEDYEAIGEHAKQYGIEVAEMEESMPFEKGSYELEYLNEFMPTVAAFVAKTKSEEKCDCYCHKGCSPWWLLLLLLLLLLLVFGWKKCEGDKMAAPNAGVGVVASDTANIAADSIAMPGVALAAADSLAVNMPVQDLGDSISVSLPDGTLLKFAKDTPEWQLFNFLNADAQSGSNESDWITLDKLRFETGSSRLAPESEAQLAKIAAVMNLFPTINIKMGGNTDNTGTDEANMKISAARAKAAADRLIALGVDAGRVSHVGFGSQRPVCPANDSDECRAANRRIDIKITK